MGGLVRPSALSTAKSPSYYSIPTVPPGTFAPPSSPPPSSPPPAVPQPPVSGPSSHFPASQPRSLYNPTYQTASYGNYQTSWAPSGTPQPGLPSVHDRANSYPPISSMVPSPPPSSPPPSSPPAAHQPSVSGPSSHFPASQPRSLYNPTYQTAPYGNYQTSWAPSGTPQPELPSVNDRVNSYPPIASMVPDLQLLCVPSAPI